MPSPTKWTLYTSNDEAWASMLADCAKAERSIVLEQFIFVTDDFGKKLIDVCTERAAAGVSVRFLWDAGGSFTFFGSNIAEDLRRKGVQLLFWKTLIPGYFNVPNVRSWFLRNHRRTLVIDGKIGYTGSMAVKDSMKGWRDTNARFDGPVVAGMQNAFERMWARARKQKHIPPRRLPSDSEFRYETNYPIPGKRRLYQALIQAIRGAQKYVYLTTPYFVPTHRLAKVIKLAAQRGIDVRLLIPEKTDQYPALDLGARSFFKPMLESGVRIFLYEHRAGEALHGKTTVIDGRWATVGSLNLDNVSLLYNFEANIISSNPRFAEELTEHFMRDVESSREVNIDEWHGRFFLEKLPEIAIKLVRRFL